MYKPLDNGFFKNFEGHNRFDVPKPVYRVTAGYGGETYLIIGSKKTVLYDCGMACFSNQVISNIHEILDPLNRELDYIALSHTHYDHIGALPYILKEYPNATVIGSPYAKKVFSSENALATIARLGENARMLYNVDCESISSEGMQIDISLIDGQEIDLGDYSLKYYEAKGHTDCSAVYMLLPIKLLFSNESLGQVISPKYMTSSPLKSFQQCAEATKRIKELNPEYIIAMHYGILPKEYNKAYFDDYILNLKSEYDLIADNIKKGLTDEELLDIHGKVYWNENRRLNQPYDAYHLNTMIIINNIRKELVSNDEL